ncbi:MAG: hypothetical protein AB1349_07325 [Elusimicrobiota bacterium]
MDFVIGGYILGGATIFGVIVGVFSVWNGRRTRADLKEIMQSIGTKIDEGFRKMDEGFRKMDEGFRKMDERTAIIAEQTEMVAKLISQIPQKTAMLTKESKT